MWSLENVELIRRLDLTENRNILLTFVSKTTETFFKVDESNGLSLCGKWCYQVTEMLTLLKWAQISTRLSWLYLEAHYLWGDYGLKSSWDRLSRTESVRSWEIYLVGTEFAIPEISGGWSLERNRRQQWQFSASTASLLIEANLRTRTRKSSRGDKGTSETTPIRWKSHCS